MDRSLVKEWTLDGLLDHLAGIHKVMPDRQFAFILGAGASFKSGIPMGKELAEGWLRDLHVRECNDGTSLENWVSSPALGIEGLTYGTAAQHYPRIFERRFHNDPHEGYAALEYAMEGKQPSLGYSLLAEIIENTRHKVVITTNFDNLVADALAMHAHQSPLVVAHESLAGFVQPRLRRPLVAKIHRGLFFDPKNDVKGVSEMDEGWTIALRKLFQHFTPIVVGYGGNDGSLMGLLNSLEPGAIPGTIFWCYREGSPPPSAAREVLSKQRGVQVKIPGFDDFMMQLAARLVDGFDVAAIAERTAELGQKRAKHYREQAAELQKSSKTGTTSQQKTGVVLSRSVQTGKSWWAWELQASAEPDHKKRDEIYRQGLRQFPKSAELTGSYANFLWKQRKDFDAAEVLYKKSLELDLGHATTSGNYASFLAYQRKDFDAAEVLYKKALELDPSHANNTGNYASFLTDQRKDFDAAEVLYKKALELDPSDANNTGNYAYFLAYQRKDFDAAEVLYKKALELDPSDAHNAGNYAYFLAYQRKDFDAAEVLYKRALELDPSHANNTGNYAYFLANQRKDFDAAEVLYKKALELDLGHATTSGNYASFLAYQRKDFDAAEVLYKKALELDPSDANNTGNYAYFLANHRKDFDAAEVLYKKALELDPSHANNTGNYANFLADQRKDFDAAEVLFKKALELDPSHANNTGNYANFLADQRKDFDAAEVLYKKALELDPCDVNTLANLASLLLLKGDSQSTQDVAAMVRKVVELAEGEPSQGLAEALLYGCMQSELTSGNTSAMLSRLKCLLNLGYVRGNWNFTHVFDAVLPRVAPAYADLFRALGAAILDADALQALDQFEEWRKVLPSDVFAQFDDQ